MKKYAYTLLLCLAFCLPVETAWGQCADCPDLTDFTPTDLSGGTYNSGNATYTICAGATMGITVNYSPNGTCIEDLDIFYSTNDSRDASHLYDGGGPDHDPADVTYLGTVSSVAGVGTATFNWSIPTNLSGSLIYLYAKLSEGPPLNSNFDNNTGSVGAPLNPFAGKQCKPWAQSNDGSGNRIGINIRPLPNVNTPNVGDPTICSGDATVTVQITNTAGSIDYQLSLGGMLQGSPVGGGGTINLTIPAPASTTSYDVIATNTNTGCTSTLNARADVTVVSVPANITATSSPTCAGSGTASVDLSNLETGVDYRLEDGSMNQLAAFQATGSTRTVTINSQPTGTITVLADNGPCPEQSVETFTFTYITLPTTNLPVVFQDECFGTTPTISVQTSQTGISYELRTGNTVLDTETGTSGTIVLTPTNITAAGTYNYTIRAINTQGGVSCPLDLSTSVSLEIFPEPIANLTGGGAYCAGGTKPDATVCLTTGENSTWTYSLSNSGGGGTVMGACETITNLPDNSYTVVTVTDGNGCTGTSHTGNIAIEQRPDLSQLTVALQGNATICQGESVDIRVSLPTGVTSIDEVDVSMSNGVSGTIPANTNFVDVPVTPSTTTNFALSSAQFAVNPGCPANTFGSNASVDVNVRTSLANATIGRDSARHCFDAPMAIEIELNNNNTATVDALVTYEFSTPSGSTTETLTIPAGAGLIDTTFIPASKGNYDFTLQSIAYVNGPDCEATYTNEDISARVLADLNLADLIGDTLCTGSDAVLTIDLPQEGFSVCVTLDNGLGQQCVTPGNGLEDITYNLGTINTASTTTYTITSVAYDNANTPECAATTLDSDAVRVLQTPGPGFSTPSSTYCLAEVVAFTNATTPEVSRDFYDYEWDFGDGNSSTEISPSHVYRSTGTFNVTLTAKSGDDCEEIDMGTVEITPGHEPVVIYKLTKQGDSGVVLVAFDENGNNQNITEYNWYDANFTALAQTGPGEPYLYVADATTASGIFVTTKIEGSECEPASVPVDRVAGLPDLEPVLRLYPNPNQGVFEVEIGGPIEGSGLLRIVDMMGRVVFQQSLEKDADKLQLKLNPSLPAGQYLLQFGIPGQPILHQRLTIQ